MCLQPVYFAEISPDEFRGQLGTMTGVLIECGYALGAIVALPVLFGTEDLWPYMFWVEAIPNIMALILLPFLHESPKFIIACGKSEIEAENSLEFFQHKDIRVILYFN